MAIRTLYRGVSPAPPCGQSTREVATPCHGNLCLKKGLRSACRAATPPTGRPASPHGRLQDRSMRIIQGGHEVTTVPSVTVVTREDRGYGLAMGEQEREDPHGIEGAVYQWTAAGLEPRLFCTCGFVAEGENWAEAGEALDEHME